MMDRIFLRDIRVDELFFYKIQISATIQTKAANTIFSHKADFFYNLFINDF